MTLTVWVLSAVLLAAIVATAAWMTLVRPTYRRYVGRRILVQIDDNGIVGTLARQSPAALTLTGASAVGRADAVDMDGAAVVIERRNVLWVQVV